MSRRHSSVSPRKPGFSSRSPAPARPQLTLAAESGLYHSSAGTEVAAPLARPTAAQRIRTWLLKDGWPCSVYLASRLLVLLVAGLGVVITHRSLGGELSLFDGQWYLRLARHGYPAHAVQAKSTLGFLPLYPLMIRALATLLSCSLLTAALVIALAGGLVAAVLVQRLAAIWWGEQVGRRAVLLFCLFPGSVVFSLAYAECLTLPLVLGCLLALRSRRWVVAGALAGLASAVEPAALILFPVCLVVAVREIRMAGWQDRSTRTSLLAPLLAPSGLALFAVYLWARTGTPFASYEAQHYGWHQGDPFALLSQPVARKLLHHPVTLFGYLPNLSLWNGILGTIFLVVALVALGRVRSELTSGALLWTWGVGVMTLWSVMSLTNARMLLIGFPAVIVWARITSGRRFAWYFSAQLTLFLLATWLTLAGHMLP